MTPPTAKKTRKKARKFQTVDFMGWKIRRLAPDKWQTDNVKFDGSKRERHFHDSLEAAKGYITEQQAEVVEQGAGAYGLTAAQKEECKASYRDLNGRATISEAVQFWMKHHPDGQAATLAEMAGAWIAHQTKNALRPTTIRQNRQRMDVFARAMGTDTPCVKLTTDTLRGYLDGLTCAPATRDGWRRCLRAFFQFCTDREIMESNPMLKIKAAPMDDMLPDFMDERTVERFLHKLEALHPESVPTFAIAFFAGLRPTEISGQYDLELPEVTEAKKAVELASETLTNAQKRGTARTIADATRVLEDARQVLQEALATQERKRDQDGVMGGLQWEDVNLRDMVIRVRPETSKTRSARLVDISDNLATWLVKHYKATGPVSPSPASLKRHRQEVMLALKMKSWLPDIARHTYATMHFAHHQNRDRLAAQMGHSGSSGVLEKHYKGLATKEQSARYWSILPAGAEVAQTTTKSSKLAGA